MKKGFTLAELLTVLMMIGVIMAIIMPTISVKFKNLKFNTINRHLDYDFTR